MPRVGRQLTARIPAPALGLVRAVVALFGRLAPREFRGRARLLDLCDRVLTGSRPMATARMRLGSSLGTTGLDVVKVDIEGHEDLFLRGGRNTIETFRPVAFLEWNRDYFDRRGVDATVEVADALVGLDYAYLGTDASGVWCARSGFGSEARSTTSSCARGSGSPRSSPCSTTEPSPPS